MQGIILFTYLFSVIYCAESREIIDYHPFDHLPNGFPILVKPNTDIGSALPQIETITVYYKALPILLNPLWNLLFIDFDKA